MDRVAGHRFGDAISPSRGRPTLYRGTLMRSRLEASWAQRMDAEKDEFGFADYEWEYEPVCFGGAAGQYLPDFRQRYHDLDHWLYFEVKPPMSEPPLAVMERMEIIWESDLEATLTIVAGGPDRYRQWVGAIDHTGQGSFGVWWDVQTAHCLFDTPVCTLRAVKL